MTELERILAREIDALRELFNRADISRIEVEIKISGRTSSLEDCLIEYNVSEHGYSVVSGNDLRACASEFLRREGWTGLHRPVCLPAPTTAQLIDDEIPF